MVEHDNRRRAEEGGAHDGVAQCLHRQNFLAFPAHHAFHPRGARRRIHRLDGISRVGFQFVPQKQVIGDQKRRAEREADQIAAEYIEQGFSHFSRISVVVNKPRLAIIATAVAGVQRQRVG